MRCDACTKRITKAYACTRKKCEQRAAGFTTFCKTCLAAHRKNDHGVAK